APLWNASRPIGPLTVERGAKADAIEDGEPVRPLLEVLYCEACGELYVGGRTDAALGRGLDLLPSEPRLEGLPDQAASQGCEDLSYRGYRLFWPTGSSGSSPVAGLDNYEGDWRTAEIDPRTARVRVFANPADRPTAGSISGFIWERTRP